MNVRISCVIFDRAARWYALDYYYPNINGSRGNLWSSYELREPF